MTNRDRRGRGGRPGYGGQRSGGQRSGGQRGYGDEFDGGAGRYDDGYRYAHRPRGQAPRPRPQPRSRRGGRKPRRRHRRPKLLLLTALLVIVAIGGAGLREFGRLKSTLMAATGTATAAARPAPSRTAPGTTRNWNGTGLTATALGAGTFAPGACTEFAPKGTARPKETVFIDAGHGGVDPGGTGQAADGTPITEAAVNLSVTMDAMKILTGEGYQVVVSRTGNTTVARLGSADISSSGLLSAKGVEDDLAARDTCANDGHASLLAGMYMNAGAAGEAGSVTVFDNARPFAASSERFANLLQSDVLAKLNATGAGVPDGGVSNDSGFGSTASQDSVAYGHLQLLGPAFPSAGFTNPSAMPGALIEPLFLSDPAEGSIAASSAGQQLIAQGLATAIQQYFR